MRWLFFLSLCFSLIGLPIASYASTVTVEQVINPQQQYGGWVSDMADVLSQETEQAINQKISALEAQNGTEIAVVTVRDTASQATPKEFATQLFNHWQIGKAGVDNGVLWLHSVGDRRVEIETGYGVEGILPDARVGQIINELVIPEFREDDFDGGTLAGVGALVTALSGEAFPLPSDSPQIIDIFSEFGLAAIAFWGASVLGYGAIRQRLKQPIKLDPQGRSRVMGKSDAALYRGVWFGTAFCGFTLCLGVLIPLLILDSSRILVISVLVALFGIIGVTAIFKIVQFITRSWKASFEKEGRDRYIGLLALPLKLFLGGFFFVTGSIIFMVIAATALFEIWGDDLGPILLFSLMAALGMGWVTYTIAQPWIEGKLKPICQTCQAKLVAIRELEVAVQLNHHQTVAQDLGSTKFTGLRCPNCCPQGSQFHIRSYVLNRWKFSECPNYQELTVTYQTKTLVHPTYQSTGLRETRYQCQACNYSKEEQSIIPRRTHSTTSSSSSSSGGSSGGGGGSFGGGSSGGGGGGGSY
ncbi:MAG: TPM domain-containing protein [Spirulinaceae cyanobacterium]